MLICLFIHLRERRWSENLMPTQAYALANFQKSRILDFEDLKSCKSSAKSLMKIWQFLMLPLLWQADIRSNNSKQKCFNVDNNKHFIMFSFKDCNSEIRDLSCFLFWKSLGFWKPNIGINKCLPNAWNHQNYASEYETKGNYD